MEPVLVGMGYEIPGQLMVVAVAVAVAGPGKEWIQMARFRMMKWKTWPA